VALLLVLACVFVYLYGRRNPGGLSERIAMRLEANYKRFGGPLDEGGDRVELEHSKKEFQNNNNNGNGNNNNNNNNGSITVSF
jgi:hypothetical protein